MHSHGGIAVTGGEVALGVLGNFATWLIGNTAGKLADYLRQDGKVVISAIKKTAEKFPDVRDASEALYSWVWSDDFDELIVALYSGENPPDINLEESLLRNCGFVADEYFIDRSVEVIEFFVSTLRTECLASDFGTVAMTNRMEVLFEQTEQKLLNAISKTGQSQILARDAELALSEIPAGEGSELE
ncbi:MAG TPA: hypothetical protein VG820_06305, partial [Fimbriimonadaceae bacterium]|nr:hypothetical protein [Fimbriimonadaceae bacterium]